MTINKTKTILVLSIAAILVLSAVALTSSTLTTAMAQVTNVPPSTPTSPCPPNDQVEHWDKIIFSINVLREGNGIVHTIGQIPGQFFNTELDLKVPDQPGVVANLKQEIVNALANQFSLTPQEKIALFNSIKIIDDKYEIVTCGQTGPQGLVGPAGATGPAGPQGPAGPSEQLVVETLSGPLTPIPPGGAVHLIVSCNPGEVPTGGGLSGSAPDLRISLSGSSGTAWVVEVHNEGESTESAQAQAVCAKLNP